MNSDQEYYKSLAEIYAGVEPPKKCAGKRNTSKYDCHLDTTCYLTDYNSNNSTFTGGLGRISGDSGHSYSIVRNNDVPY